jgi:diaminohydroxyphosphoribosylaminopyrimidine deaminase/5-amino-6-(5-phosphoribosylamino)uracil reductase
MVNRDEQFMQRAIELAARGLGAVSPNPLVGCVVVHDDKIISEGWHKEFGGPHAEVHALNGVSDSSRLAASTVYVNLEPCSHFGKTPPCADLLVEKKVNRVVIAIRDPNPLVSGKGIARLRAAGIEITERVLEKEGTWLNRRFFAFMKERIPYVILKWAESADGIMAPDKERPVWISNERSRQRVHQWRSQEDAILVGAGTAEKDNPRLNVRDWSGRHPLRIVMDPALRLPDSLHVFDMSQPTLRYNRVKDDKKPNLTMVRLNDEDMIPGMLHDLHARNIGSLIVEGGPKTLAGFIAAGWWHEARIFRSTTSLGKGTASPLINGEKVWEDESTGDRLSVSINPLRVRTG